jgi:hypothetical protein
MTRIFSLLTISTLALIGSSGQALALAGGPFDNGLPSGTLEYPQNGYYAATMKFKNGNGYCYFNPSQVLVSEDQSTPTAFSARGTSRNRSVLYYRGVSYVGAALGMTDPGAGVIQCTINASSEASFQVQQQQQNANFFNFTASTVSVANQLVASNRNFTANGNWEGVLNRRNSQLRFTGKGELAFLAPNGADALANIALSSYTNFIGAINSFYAGITQLPAGTNFLDFFLGGQQAIDNALARIPTYLTAAGLDSADQNSQKVKVRVRGSFRYTVNRI